MFRGFGRFLLRVASLPPAIKHWQMLGGTLIASDRHSATLRLPDSGEITLHCDASLPDQAFFLRVESVRAMYARRQELNLEFKAPPTLGARGYYATVRDALGHVLRICDDRPDAGPDDHLAEDGSQPRKFPIDRARLNDVYQKVGRTADDLPYTAQFESVYNEYAMPFGEPAPSHAEVWRHLLSTRKAGKLIKLGAARSRPPTLDQADRDRLVELLGADIGKRDRLPYTERFESLVEAFNRGRRQHLSAHQIWRVVATLAK
jgi:hypothetical protein